MNGGDDLLDDILPMVIYGILDSKDITGRKNAEIDRDREGGGDAGGETSDGKPVGTDPA